MTGTLWNVWETQYFAFASDFSPGLRVILVLFRSFAFSITPDITMGLFALI